MAATLPRKILTYVGLALLALVTFVFALQLTFPYGRVKDKLVEALASKYDVSIGGVERGIIPGRVYFNMVTLRAIPTSEKDVPAVFFIERLEVDVGLIVVLRGAVEVNIDAKIGPGKVAGSVTLSKGSTVVDFTGSSVPATSLPMKDAIGLPMSGKLDFAVDLTLPNERSKTGRTSQNWQKATGAMRFACPTGCTFGDGKTKLKPKLNNARSQAFAGDGVEFGKIKVDTLLAKMVFKGGQLDVTTFETTSQDGELHVDFSATLAPVFGDSMVAGCLRFKGSAGLQEREPRTAAALSTTGAQLGPDNLFHIRLDGRFKEMKRLAQFCGDAVKSAAHDDMAAKPVRPSLTVQPPDATLGGSAATPPPPPPAPTPEPPPAVPADAAPVAPATPPNSEAPATPTVDPTTGGQGSAVRTTPPDHNEPDSAPAAPAAP